MATNPRDGRRRPDLRSRLDRDLARYDRREPGTKSFWRSMRVIGAIGWPIVLMTLGGVFAGRWLDARWGTGLKATIALMVCGLAAGAVAAWQVVRQSR